ncbi:MAG TPA: ECF-type sigma factor, partial [Xanthomonadaceae bacterium]|nr:ECF-type sigma factor [Xanthomonadaceae bacterium]
QRITELPDEVTPGISIGEEMLHLDSALQKLAEVDKRLAQVVELRYFAGLSEANIGELLQCSERTVRRDWQKARLFLLAELQTN